MREELHYRLALCRVPQVGTVHARLLIDQYGSATDIFKAPLPALTALEGIGPVRARAIKKFTDFQSVEKELIFLEQQEIQPLFLTDAAYPQRLTHCFDPPTLLYFKGTADLNAARVIAIIGSRHHTEYGRQVTEQILEGLEPFQPVIISGLAYGIDAWAHRYALKKNCPTVGVLAHGLDNLYPPAHLSLARDMIAQGGGLLSEFPQGTDPDKHNFPIRNRIVAGMCDALVVVETAKKGGSMITATLANGYNRDVFAVPGKWSDPKSSGCNELIRTQQAQLLTSPKEIAEMLGWVSRARVPVQQQSLFPELSVTEQELLTLLQDKQPLHIDEWQYQSGLSSSAAAALLLKLEMQGLIQSLPGKRFSLR